MKILDKLRGGDLRSIGRADEVAANIEENSTLFEKIFPGLYDIDPVVKARSADVIEKATLNRPELLSNHKQDIISILQDETQQEVCWHIAQIIPRLDYTPAQEKKIIAGLNKYLSHKSKIVRVCALEALTDLAQKNPMIVKEVIKKIRFHVKTGSPAIKARGRKILKRLNTEGE